MQTHEPSRLNARRERPFFSEVEFITVLASLLRSHPDFKNVRVDPILDAEGQSRLARPDIMAVRKVDGAGQTLVIECKNTSILFNQWVLSAVNQLKYYGKYVKNAVLVLALPGRLTDEDAYFVRRSGIELWDIDAISSIFADQITPTSGWIAPPQKSRARPLSLEETLLEQIKACAKGREAWNIYQKLIGRVLTSLFTPSLSAPIFESADASGVNRRDFILPNFAQDGFWQYVRARYAADFIVVDAKNHTGKVKKKDILQIANYLKPHGCGLFAMIISRNGPDRSAVVTAREQWLQFQKLIIVLDDTHVEAMLRSKSSNGNPTEVLAEVIQAFRLSM